MESSTSEESSTDDQPISVPSGDDEEGKPQKVNPKRTRAMRSSPTSIQSGDEEKGKPRKVRRKEKGTMRSSPIFVGSGEEEDGKPLKVRQKGKGRRVKSSSDSSGDEAKRGRKQAKRKKDRHLTKYCPVAGCMAKPQQRLATHIKHYHPHIAKKARKDLAARASVQNAIKA